MVPAAHRFVVIMGLALGGIFGVLGAWILVEQYRFEHAGVRAEARVIAHQTRTELDKWQRPVERPIDVYELTDESGRTIRFDDDVTLSWHARLGRRKGVYYMPGAPELARLAGANTMMALCTLTYALVMLSFGLRSWRSLRGGARWRPTRKALQGRT